MATFVVGLFMSNLIVVFVCLLIGLLLQLKKDLPESFSASLNFYVIFVALPALVLFEIHHLTLNANAMLPVVMAWAVMFSTAVCVWCVSRLLRWSRPVTGALMLTVPLGNTGFVGIRLGCSWKEADLGGV